MLCRSTIFPRSFVDFLPFMFLLAIIPITYWFEIWIVLPELYPFSEHPIHHSVLFVIGHFLLLNVLGNLLGALAVDTSIKGRIMPSLESEDAAGYCDKCACCTPKRAYHCPTCGICILRRDHHCAFTGSCIGLFNYRYFLMFLLYMLCSTLLCLPYNIMFVWDFCTGSNLLAIAKVVFPVIMVFYGAGFNTEQGYLILCFINVAGMLFIGAWFYFHFSLAMSGKVVHEHRHNVGLYDQGVRENLQEVLGKRWHLVWLSPFLKSELTGDGIKFPKKPHSS